MYFPVVSVARVLLSWRDCSGVVRDVLFSVDSLARVKFGEKDDYGGCRGGSFFFGTSVSLCVISTMAVSSVISLMILDLSWVISVPTLGLLVAAKAASRISAMRGMYALCMNHYFGYSFARHLWM